MNRRRFSQILFILSYLFFSMQNITWAAGIEDIEYLFMQGQFDEAINLCKGRAEKNKRNLDKIYFILGNCFLKKGDYNTARENFTTLLNDFPKSKLRENANLGLAEAFFFEAKFDEAKIQYEGLINAYPDSELISICYYRLANIAQKKGKWEDARKFYSLVKNDFPNSFEAKNVDCATTDEQFYYTIQVGSFSDKKNALNLSKILKEKGFDADISEINSGKDNFYRVRVGKFDKREDVLSCQEKLKKEGFPAKVCP